MKKVTRSKKMQKIHQIQNTEQNITQVTITNQKQSTLKERLTNL